MWQRRTPLSARHAHTPRLSPMQGPRPATAPAAARTCARPSALAAVARARASPPAPAAVAPADAAPPTRRAALLAGAAAVVGAALPPPSIAVQGLTAGRIPGLSAPDAAGQQTYRRPEGKSGGHGVGWSEIPRYSFQLPGGKGWEETPVSIADLGGTELDLRFASPADGSLAVVVAPVLRFVDVGFNADVRIDTLGPPDRIIAGFAPELFGAPLEAGDVEETEVVKKGNLTYYRWLVKPLLGSTQRHAVAATAVGNRVFILTCAAKPREWKRAGAELKAIAASFTVPGG